MSTSRQIMTAAVGMTLAAAAIGEHFTRRHLERGYRDAIAARRQLELQLGEATAQGQQLQAAFTKEHERAESLSGSLESMRAQMEDAANRLTEETRTVRELQMRLAATQQQMDQLQGELSVTLQGSRRAAGGEPGAVQLERVVVSDAGSALQGRVVSVHRNWNFVIVDLGWDAVRIGDTLSIFRNEQLLAKARVERVQEGVCAASLLPDWQSVDVQVNDLAKVL